MGLDFNTLRKANELRLPTFKNRLGETAHSEQDGSDWDLNAWYAATVGEWGEANEELLAFVQAAMITKKLGMTGDILKKYNRGEFSIDELRDRLAHEIADTVTYLDLFAKQLGIDMGAAVVEKFNKVSDRVGSPIFIAADQHGISVVQDMRKS